MLSAAQEEINIQTIDSIIWIRQVTQLAVMALDFCNGLMILEVSIAYN